MKLLLHSAPLRSSLLLASAASLLYAAPVRAQDLNAALASKTTPAGAIWLETLDLKNMTQGWSVPGVAKSVAGSPIRLKGRAFAHGVGTHATARFAVDLKGNATRFTTFFGVDDEVQDKGSVSLRVLVDDQVKLESPELKGGDAPILVDVNLRGAQTMRVEVLEGANADSDHADLAGAAFFLTPQAQQQGEASYPTLTPPPPRVAAQLPPVQLAPPGPQINGARITGASPHKPFLYLIAATGKGPLAFSARGLPAGLSLDAKTGIITGQIAAAGTYDVTLEAKGAAGIDSKPLRIVCAPNKLALTPILGWNAWSVFGEWVTARDVARQADWMVQSGLASRGWQYIIVDDTWQSRRDPDGSLGANRRFGSMKSLCDYVHSKGLKIGLASSATPNTCNGFSGSPGWEDKDAALYARWGIDLVKYDWCPESARKSDTKRDDVVAAYKKMRQALDKSGRDIVLSMVTYGFGGWAPDLGHDAGAQLWRTSDSMIDTWESMSKVAFDQEGNMKSAGAGGWSDFGPLMVGRFTPRNAHFSNLSPDEQKLQVTAWAIAGSPMILSCDLSQLDPNNFFRLGSALLMNTEVLGVNQDEGGQPARVVRSGETQVWTRPLADGRLAVGLFNRGWGPQRVTASWAELGLSGPQKVRDAWLGRDMGSISNQLDIQTPGHGAGLYLVGTAKQ